MRWKLIRRRLAHSAPRVAVRSHLPWPVRWIVLALLFGFFGALGMSAFDAGRKAAGLDQRVSEEAQRLRGEVVELREERDKAQSIANTADSLLKTEKAAQDKLAEQVKALEAENLALKADLGFFERLLPSTSGGGGAKDDVSVRGLLVDVPEPGQLRYQLLIMQPGRTRPEFQGRYDLTLTGQMDGKPWTLPMPGGAKALNFKQYQRLEGMFAIPAQAVVKSVQVRVHDTSGAQRATQTVRL